MNIYEALSKDHRRFETLLDSLVAASQANHPSWKEILDELRRDVIAHAHAEEAVLYNTLRAADRSKLVAHSFLEHATAEGELRTLSLAKLADKSWTSLSERLRKDLRHHIEEEETRVFEAARQVLSQAEAEQLGEDFERRKLDAAKDGDSVFASTMDLMANLLPPRRRGSGKQDEPRAP